MFYQPIDTAETLESLPARLTRLIAEWKAAQSDPADNVRAVADRKLAELVAFHPELTEQPKPDLEETLIEQLMFLPGHIKLMQEVYDADDRAYQKAVTSASIEALTAPLFTGKDNSVRAASNDKERELAVDTFLLNDANVVEYTKNRAQSLRYLQEAKNRFEAARLMVQLLCRGNGK